MTLALVLDLFSSTGILKCRVFIEPVPVKTAVIGWKEKVFEYDRQFGVEVSSIYGFSKSQFNSEDFGVITCDTRVDLDG